MESQSQALANQRRGQQRPKRRASCDACGAAKLRCDRSQPSCERCINQGLQCVYSICRKMGKPSQRSINSKNHSAGEDLVSNSSATSSRRAGVLDINPTLSVTLPPSMDSITSNDFSGNVLAPASDPNALDDFFKSPLSPSWQNFLSADSSAEGMSPNAWNSVMGGLSLDMHDFTTSHTSTDGDWSDDSAQANAALPASGTQEHDCTRNAYAILRSLSYKETDGQATLPPPNSQPFPVVPDAARSVTFAQMLEVNRAASKSLEALLVCPCASSPGLALMYSSILFNILGQYGRAASGIHCNQSRTINGSAGQSATQYASQASGNAGQATSVEDSSIPNNRSAPSFAPSQIWIGSFSIDSGPTQAVLSVQVLNDEVRKIEPLVNLLATSGRGNIDRSTSDSDQGMGESLRSWVRSEQTKTASLVRRRLAHLIGSLGQDTEHTIL